MTYRVYARWPEGGVSDKTTTESRSVADFAWVELRNKKWKEHDMPEGLTFTFREGDKKKPVQIDYVNFTS
jgi:hypothetical protein